MHCVEARHGKALEGMLKRYFADELFADEVKSKLSEISKKLGL